MPRKILFTPVGGTDPIPIKNDYDGAILHICRHYPITEVHMYMSYEILQSHEKDNRYCLCLGKLAESTGRNIETRIIKRPELRNVHEFNFFYDDFRKEVEKIIREMSEDDTLYLNISSGTPAMKSCLYALAAMLDYPAILIQVSTPNNCMNTHTHKKDYEDGFWEDKWEINEDNNNPDSPNRCAEVIRPALSMIRNEQILLKLINEYDYHAAVVMAEDMPASATARYLPYLRFAEARKRLDSDVANRYHELAETFIPVRQGDTMKLVEYALELDLKRRRGEYADFLRALTPLFAELLILILRSTFNVDVRQFSDINAKGLRWNMGKLDGTRVERILKQNPHFQESFVTSSHLVALVDAYAGSDEQLLKTNVDSIRRVEEIVRNLVAHQVVGITGDVIQRKTGLIPDRIMTKIRSLFAYAGIRVNDDTWNSYDRMNEKIIGLIGTAPDTPR